MMKRFVCLLLALMLGLAAVPVALADANGNAREIVTIPWDELPETVDGQHHYLLLCVDQWTGKPGNLGYTDGIVLVTLDTRAHRIMMTSLIREALIKRPDGKLGRVNNVARTFSPEALCTTLSEHFGIKIEKYILFDFSQIQNIIEFLGGVDITITNAESAYLQRYAIKKNATTPQLSGAGTYRFNGHAAVIYMRIRKIDSDLIRTKRVRTVLSTLADQCREITYDNARALVDSVMANTTMTNMSLDDMVEAMNYAMDLRGCTIEELRIPADGDSLSITYAAMSVHDVDWVASRQKLADFLENSFLVLDDE